MRKKKYQVEVGKPHPLGSTVEKKGVNFAIFSEHATKIELLLFSKPNDAKPVQVVNLEPEKHKSYSVWHVFIKGLKPGVGYAYRVDGSDDKHLGHRFDADKLMIDPYARANTMKRWDRELACVEGDNLKHSMRSVVVELGGYNWRGDKHPKIPKEKSVIYEMHVGGFTKLKTSEVKYPGTFLGLVEKIPYLKKLGVTAVELMPVTQFDETEIVRLDLEGKPLKNYWGYSPMSFFGLHPGYCVSEDPIEQLNEFKTMVRRLHKVGIEVILDMVFNHSDEGNESGPTMCFRGLDNSVYYHLNPDDKQYYYDYSGCGNCINANHPVVTKLIQDSLEYWVTEMHVDGFRLDEASVLSRNQRGEPDGYSRVLWELELSDVLQDTKLIAEAWDAGGLYEIGSFPGYRWSEWNGKYRDAIRRFVRGDTNIVGEMGRRFSGSADLYERNQEKPINSINFVTCHDGFTLYDLVSYNGKHNEANGEGNQDGISENLSWNCGAEGDTQDEGVLAFRELQIKNFLTILLLSQGVPMILMGDEVMRTQWGNNNAYCQDNEMSWLDWNLVEENKDLLAFVKKLIAFRKRHEVLQKRNFSFDKENSRGLFELEWHGCKVHYPGWQDPQCKQLAITLGAMEENQADLFVAMNMGEEGLDFEVSPIQGREWKKSIATNDEVRIDKLLDDQPIVWVPGRSVVVLEST